MQYSLAQQAANIFSKFIDEIFDDPRFIELAGNGESRSLSALPFYDGTQRPEDALERLTLTDWFAVWLLLGYGTEATANRFEVYLQVVVLVAAEREQVPSLYEGIDLIMPRLQDDGDQRELPTPAYQGYEMPPALSSEFYNYANCLSTSQRQVQLGFVLWPQSR